LDDLSSRRDCFWFGSCGLAAALAAYSAMVSGVQVWWWLGENPTDNGAILSDNCLGRDQRQQSCSCQQQCLEVGKGRSEHGDPRVNHKPQTTLTRLTRRAKLSITANHRAGSWLRDEREGNDIPTATRRGWFCNLWGYRIDRAHSHHGGCTVTSFSWHHPPLTGTAVAWTP